MSSKKSTSPSKKSKPIWRWWYGKNASLGLDSCLVQQIYLVLSILGGLAAAALVITLLLFKIPGSDSQKDVKQEAMMRLLSDFKVELAIVIALTFIVSFAVNNLLLTWYCNHRPSAGLNVVLSLLMFFIVTPIISNIIGAIFMSVFAGTLVAQARAIKNA